MSDIPSEKVQAKAGAYLLNGQVRVQQCNADTGSLTAHVTPPDGGDPYIVRHNSNGWHCDCPARVQVCAHVLACQTVTSLPEGGEDTKRVTAFPRDLSIDEILNGS